MGELVGIARRDAKRGAMQELQSATVTADAGVANDFRGKPGKRQVTILSADVWNAVCGELDHELPWTTRRVNLLVAGVELPRSAGQTIRVGPITLRVTMETDPCSRMDEQHDGLRQALQPDWRGGVCCEVLSGGDIAIGDSVRVDAV